jgi:hypothetical protein
MSEDITIGGGEETILGTLELAQGYVAMMPGQRYEDWTEAAELAQQKSLVAAVRFINGIVWSADYDTLAKRDAVAAFKYAQYELAVLIHEDTEITDEAPGSNISSLKAGSAGITFFNPTTNSADPLPPVLMRLVGAYLSASSSSGPVGGGGQSGSCHNPFADCADNDRKTPW